MWKTTTKWVFQAFNKYWEANCSSLPFPWHWEYEQLTYYDIYILKRFATLYGYGTARELWSKLRHVYYNPR